MTDPWAWLETDGETRSIDLASHPVSAVLLTEVAEQVRPLLAEQTAQPTEIIVADTLAEGVAQATGDWVWLFPREVRPAPRALAELLATASDAPRNAVVGPLMVQSHRRARVDLIESCGLTTTPAGRVVAAVESGEPDQGQLSTMVVLAVDPSAALVRRDVWDQVDGVLTALPDAVAGVELGRRVNTLGLHVLAEPAARVARTASDAADPADRRAWELRLAAASGGWWRKLRLLLGSLFAALGFLLGKDAADAAAELRGLRRWLVDRDARAVLAGRDVDRAALAGLTPTRRQLFGAAFDRAAGRFAEGWSRLADAETRTSLDELTGDDFAARGQSRVSPLTVAGAVVALTAAVAGWRLIGEGRLTGAGLLPSQQSWTELLNAWLDPIAGAPQLSGPPWLGSTALAALATFGQVEWLVTLGFLVAVPLSWLLALRALRAQEIEGPPAVLAALGYALAPVLSGALGGGWLGVLTWAVLLPLMAHALIAWTDDHTWRSAGAIGLWLAFAVVEVPLAWPLVLLAMAPTRAIRSLRGVGQWLLVAASGLVGLGPAVVGWHPGRFLTGASPALAGLDAPDPWLLALAHPSTTATAAPLWVSAVVVGAAWLLAVLGLWRRPRQAWPGFAVAAVGLLAAVLLSRLVVEVPPGVQVRPQPLPWLVLMLGGLALAAGNGLTGLAGQLRHRTLGGWHAAVLGLTVLAVAAVGTGTVWWGWQGTAGLQRTESATLPPFVRVAMTSDAPVRTLAIERGADQVSWALLEGDLPRLGEDERGLPGALEPQRGLAASVVNRLLSGSADNELTADLVRLGVGYVWLGGSDAELRTAIGNVPGLGIGTGDDAGATWPVPGGARAVVESAELQATGDGLTIAPGGDYRRLLLAEPADPRWWASVDGSPLTPVTLSDGRQGFELGAATGVLHYGLSGAEPAWPLAQLGALLVLAILAAPRLGRRR